MEFCKLGSAFTMAGRRLSAIVAGLIAVSTFNAHADEASLEKVFAARFPGAEVLSDTVIEYDERAFFSGFLKSTYEAGDVIEVEGRVRTALHHMPTGRSTLESFRAYQRAISQMGYSEIFSCKNRDGCKGNMTYMMVTSRKVRGVTPFNDVRYALFKREAGGATEYLALMATGADNGNPERMRRFVMIDALTTEAEETEIEFLTASDMARSIASDGTVSLYGIEFANASAEILPSSMPTLKEMAAYLKSAPEQKILIVGHTDNVGDMAYNRELSEKRAQAVRAHLASEHDIPETQMASYGVGFLAPKASNTSEEGRARNRRVEIVAR
ncbi:MAG: OmpA family protein [Pseudomonadota bacterium]